MELIETIRDTDNVIRKPASETNATKGFKTNKTPKLEATDLPPVKFKKIDLLWPRIAALPAKTTNQAFHAGSKVFNEILEIIILVINTPIIAFDMSKNKTTVAALLPIVRNTLVAPVDPEPKFRTSIFFKYKPIM